MILNLFKSKARKQTLAFYNIENLFDIYNDDFTRDDDLLPTAKKRWTVKRYKNKLKKIGFVISNIGKEETGKHPAIVGLSEVENEAVLQDLIASKHLIDLNYNFIHYNSPDERGIDVALLYDESVFKLNHSETFSIELFDDNGGKDYTRDILLVNGLFEGLELNILVNHWPSRRGDKNTEHKRLIASSKASEIISNIKAKDLQARILVMGDFNDDPFDESIKQLANSQGLFNPMDTLLSYNRGTTNRHSKWNLFDQILFTPNFFDRKKNNIRYLKANIFDSDFLKVYDGKYKGSPYRTYVGKQYKGGYSDHFPVYITVSKK